MQASDPVAVADALEMEKVVVQGASPGPRPPMTRTDVEASRPRSELTPQAIEQIATLSADFGTLANLLPSFVGSAPNGNGFDAAKGMTLRGFPDGQFNVTLDAIPFADPDGFSHHSTSLFPAAFIETLAIDRSPGGGTSLGYATLGGSLDIRSLAIPEAAGARLYGASGSFATRVYGVRLNTARPGEDGQTGLLVDLQHMQSAGAMADNDGRRDDLLLKAESLIAGMRLTLLYSHDDYHFINPPSVTTDQIAQSGAGAGLGTTPGTPLYNQYAKTDRSADFGYARLQGRLDGGWALSETLYTYGYVNRGLSVNGDVTLPSSYQVGAGYGVAATDIAGRVSTTRYRTVGNVFQFERQEGARTWRGGLWLEHSQQTSRRNALDLSSGAAYLANKAGATSALYDDEGSLDTWQPFAELEWQATPALVLKPGLRYQQVRRGFEAQVVPNSRPGTGGEIGRTVGAFLPSLEGNYAFTPATHAYLQWSRGSLVPNQSFFYTNHPALGNQAQPQTSQAVQGGVIYSAGPLAFAADAYVVDLDDYVSSTTDANKNTVFVNSGRVRYRGIEAEGSVNLAPGLTWFANASLMRAQFRDAGMVSAAQPAGATIPLVPSYTALLGILYGQGAWSASVTTKFVGTEYQGPGGSSDGDDRRVSGYAYSNATISRKLDGWVGPRHATVSLAINNLEDRSPVTDSAGRSAVGPTGPLLVNVLARRNYMVSFRCDL